MSVAHLTVYLTDDVERWVRKAAKFLALAGAFPDFPDAEELRRGYGDDAPR